MCTSSEPVVSVPPQDRNFNCVNSIDLVRDDHEGKSRGENIPAGSIYDTYMLILLAHRD